MCRDRRDHSVRVEILNLLNGPYSPYTKTNGPYNGPYTKTYGPQNGTYPKIWVEPGQNLDSVLSLSVPDGGRFLSRFQKAVL